MVKVFVSFWSSCLTEFPVTIIIIHFGKRVPSILFGNIYRREDPLLLRSAKGKIFSLNWLFDEILSIPVFTVIIIGKS